MHTDVPTNRRLQMYPLMYPHCRYTDPSCGGGQRVESYDATYRAQCTGVWRYIKISRSEGETLVQIEHSQQAVIINCALIYVFSVHTFIIITSSTLEL